MKVNMTPNPLDVVTIHASQGDTEARQWEFELHNNGELIDTSDVKEQLVFKAYKGGTEQLLPENGSTPTTSPFLGDIKYPQGLLTGQEFIYRQSPTESDGLAKITDIKGNTLVWNQICCKERYFTRGANEWQNTFTENGVTFTYLDDYTVRIAGTPTARTYIYVNRLDDSANYPVKQGEKLLLRCSNVPNGIDIFSSFYLDNTWKAAGPQKSNKYVTVPSDVNKMVCMGIDVQASLIGQTIDVTVSLNAFNLTKMFGSGNEPTEEEFNSLFPLYYSYNAGTLLSFNGTGIKTANADETEEHTTNLPVSTYFPNGMKSAGNVYDELTESKAITRIGAVDLGTLTWYKGDNAEGIFLTASISNMKYASVATDRQKGILCDKYLPSSVVSIDNKMDDKSMLKSTDRFAIRDTTYTDATAFKTAMSGVYLYYELATPTETSFTTASLVTENAEIPLSNNDGVLIGKCTEQLSENPGFIDAKIKLTDSDGTCYSNKLQLHVERKPS